MMMKNNNPIHKNTLMNNIRIPIKTKPQNKEILWIFNLGKPERQQPKEVISRMKVKSPPKLINPPLNILKYKY